MSEKSMQERMCDEMFEAEARTGRDVEVILISDADFRTLSEEGIEFLEKQDARIARFMAPGSAPQYTRTAASVRQATESFIAGKGLFHFNGVELLLARVARPRYMHDLCVKAAVSSP